MKPQPALNWLVPLIVLIALVSSGVGLIAGGGDGPFTFTTLHGQEAQMYGRGMYRNDTIFAAAGFRGADAVVLFIGLPVLILSYLKYRRSSLRGALLLAGTLSYFVYIGASMTFGAAFNRLFLVYTALFSASLFAFIAVMLPFDLPALAERVSPRLPRRGLAALLIVAGLGTFFLWLSELIGPILEGSAPELLGPYTTMFSHGFDSAIITPAAVLAAVCLLRRAPLGLLLTPVILILCIFNGINVLAQTASQTIAGIIFPPQVYIGMIGSWVCMGAFAVWLVVSFMKSLDDTPDGRLAPAH